VFSHCTDLIYFRCRKASATQEEPVAAEEVREDVAEVRRLSCASPAGEQTLAMRVHGSMSISDIPCHLTHGCTVAPLCLAVPGNR
jgi:hypothetical protein